MLFKYCTILLQLKFEGFVNYF